jgi:phenylacetate-CoA ligase
MKIEKNLSKGTLHFSKQIARWFCSFLPFQVRYGKDFLKMSKQLEVSERWSIEKLEDYQNRCLSKLINHAYQNVPYYHKLFNKHGILPGNIKTTHNLKIIPPLSKDDLRNNFKDLIATNMKNKELICKSTSGTSGRPVHFYLERRQKQYLYGSPFRWRHFRWGGYGLEDKCATLYNWRIPPKTNGQRRLFYYDPMRRLLILSTYDMTRKNIRQYAEALQKHNPEFLHGFPSALEMMAKYLREQIIAPPITPKAIFTQSEVVYPWQRRLIEQYFGCEIYDWYGMEERAIAASECELHSDYHIFSEYCVVEVLGEGKNVVGEEGELISTPLDNYAMPLLRYKTGDLGTLVNEKCACGRTLPLMRLSGGRDRNFVVTKSDSLISVTIVDIPNATKNIEQFQFVQEEVGTVTLKVLRKDSFSDEDLNLIKKDLKEKFGNMIEVRIKFVERMDRTSRGKLPLLVQKLNFDKDLYPV